MPFELVTQHITVDECRLRLDKTNVPHGRKIRVTYVDEAGYAEVCFGPIVHNAFWPKQSPPDCVCVNIGINGQVVIKEIAFVDILDLDTGQETDTSIPDWVKNIVFIFDPKPS